MIDPAINLLLALGLAALFAAASMMKLRSYAIFVATLADYRLMPRKLLQPAGLAIVALEMATAAGLIWPATRASCAVLGAAGMLLYAAAIGINLLRGRYEIDCGCSLRRRPIARWMIARNLLFSVALLATALPTGQRILGLGDAATVGAALVVSTLLYVALDLLLGQTASVRHPSLEHP